jgi:Holliday junction DNA helicase RuvA
MIGRLRGTVAEISDVAIVDVGGVGYEVHMPSRDLAALVPGEAVTLVVETVVREDMIRLYGFRDAAGRDWFRLLQGVQGVGAKVALGVLSILSADELAGAIAGGDKAAIARAPGVGKRVAERIVAELKAKMPAAALTAAPAAAPRGAADEPAADAISALVNLGYDEAQARAAVSRLRAAAPEAGAAELIRAGLKALAA